MRQGTEHQISDVFVARHEYYFPKNGFPILLATIWPSEHLIESVTTQKIAAPSYKIEI
jgi:hypothetical protein